MSVVFVEIVILMILIKSQKRIHRLPMLLGSFLIQMLILFLYRAELQFFWNREVHWSDAEYYWNATMRLLNEGSIEGIYNTTYVYYSYLIQRFSPFYSVFWNNISNTLLLNLAFFLSVQIFKKNLETTMTKIPYSVYFLTIANPLVIYSLMRNLKDVLFLFLTVLSVYALFALIPRNLILKTMLLIPYAFLFHTLLVNIRPWGDVIIVGNMFLFIIHSRRKSEKILFLAVFFGVIFVLAASLYTKAISWLSARDLLLEQGTGQSGWGGFLTGFGRILVGPGPIRSILGETYFQFYTYTGNASSFVGSLIAWFILPYYLTRVLLNFKRLFKQNLSQWNMYFFLILLEIIAIYSYFYGGSTELRFRGVLYVLVGISFLPTFSNMKKSGKVTITTLYSFKQSELLAYSAILFLFVVLGITNSI